jgi:hypothetical protein
MSHTHLPATDVRAACASTLAAIHADRDDLFMRLVEAKRPRRFWFRRSWASAAKLLTDADDAIIAMRGEGVVNPVAKLLQLARAASKMNSRFTVEVSADDYALIAVEYERNML